MKQPSPSTQPHRILLVGMMGSGKTSVGRILAERLGVPLDDNDDALRERAGGGPGAVFEAQGVDVLHDVEAGLLRERLASRSAAAGTVGFVLTVPASAVVDADLRRTLSGAGTVVWLRARPEMLHARLSAATYLGGRPHFQPDMAAWLRAESLARAPLFGEIADVTVDVDNLVPWQVAQGVLDGLGLGAFGWLPGSFQGVVLDLDGLLIDTEVQWTEAKRRLYAERGVAFSVEDHRAVLGTSEEYTAAVFAKRFGLGPEHEPDVLQEYLGHATSLFAEGVPRRPGALELVASLRGRVPLGLASNTRRAIVTNTVEMAGLTGCFDVIVTGDEADPKPKPGIYLEACRQLGIEPGRSVAVEDSPTGVLAARAAGMICIGVPSDPEHPPDQADCVRASLVDLIEPAG